MPNVAKNCVLGAAALIAILGLWPQALIRPAAAADVAAAEKEGSVTVYVLWLTNELESVTRAFKKKYPAISVDFYRSGGPVVMERYTTELQSAGNSADVVSIDPAELHDLADHRQLEPYTSPEAAVFPANDRDPNGYYTTFFAYMNGFMINKRVFPNPATWPSDWTDFIKPRPEWSGKVCLSDVRVADHAYNNIAALKARYGDKVWDIYEGLVQDKARSYTGAPQGAQWAASGQCPIVFQIPFQNFVPLAKAGAPVAWVPPASGMIPSTVAVAIGKNAKHPNAARLFYDFVLSQEGQAALAALYVTPLRPGASTSWWPDGLGLPPLSSVKIMEYDPLEAARQRKDVLDKAVRLLGLQ